MNRTYELMVILKPEIPAEKEKEIRSMLEKLIGGAQITEMTILGKKTLAYPIKKQQEGLYVVATLTGNIRVSDLEREMQLGSDVVRFLLTVKE